MLLFILLFALAVHELWYSSKVLSHSIFLYTAAVMNYLLRPSVYTFGGAGSSADQHVLIREPQLFYMITFDADDVADLAKAYRSFKASAKGPASNG